MNNFKIVALIQARMGSSRLPGKILKNIQGHSVIWHIYNRLKNVRKIDEIVVATSEESSDNILIEHLKKYNIKFFRGSEKNVLDRFYGAASSFKSDYIIRITADCPLIDPIWITKAIEKILNDRTIDYVSLPTGAGVLNEKVNKLPDGLDTEVFKFVALEKTWKEAKDPLDRGEAVTSYIWRNRNLFKTSLIFPNKDYGNLRWTLDTKDDFRFVEEVYNELFPAKENFNFSDIINLLELKPELTKINSSSIDQAKYADYYKKSFDK